MPDSQKDEPPIYFYFYYSELDEPPPTFIDDDHDGYCDICRQLEDYHSHPRNECPMDER